MTQAVANFDVNAGWATSGELTIEIMAVTRMGWGSAGLARCSV